MCCSHILCLPSDALIDALLALVGSGGDDLDFVVDGDSYHAVFLDVAGSPVCLGHVFGDGAGLVDDDLFFVGDLDGHLDVVGLGYLGDHDVPLAGDLGAPGGGTAVGDAASAVGLALTRAVGATAALGFAGGNGVEGNLDIVLLHVLSDLGVAGA